ncbi:MAG: serine/threonine-protein kinase, partial [Polyangiales bacterium]
MRDLVDELLQAKVKATLFGGDHAPRLGRLMILDRIGSGAMGTVFAAYDPELDRKVAVKLVRTGGAETTTRVAREARALGKLAHPNVVAVHDVGELDGAIYIVMELVEGVPLRTWIAGDRDWRDVVRVMSEAAAGLAAAHRAGLVHRDIKPDNILIGADRARIVDFGLAHDQTGGDDGKSAGTPSYMAPEVLDERAATAASDQFSFGVTLYEALYGVRPHAGRTRDELRETAKLAASARPVKSSPPVAIDANASTEEPASRRTTAPGGSEPAVDPAVDPAAAKQSRPSVLARVVAETTTASEPTRAAASDAASDADADAASAADAAAGSGSTSSSSSVLARASSSLARTARAVRSTPPGWLHAIVVRALAADPQRRFPSMAELAAALGRDRRRRKRVIALVAAGAVAGAVLGVVLYRHQAVRDLCGGGAERRAAAWTPSQTEAVKRSLGTAAWTTKAIEGLDGTAARWETSYRTVCEATRVRGDQSDTLLDLRMRCLDRALDRFGALTVALAAPLDGPS